MDKCFKKEETMHEKNDRILQLEMDLACMEDEVILRKVSIDSMRKSLMKH